jgi:hypothetical protein
MSASPAAAGRIPHHHHHKGHHEEPTHVRATPESIVAQEFTPETNLQAPVMHETRTAEAATPAWLVYAVVAAIAAGILGFIGLFLKKHRSEVGAA